LIDDHAAARLWILIVGVGRQAVAAGGRRGPCSTISCVDLVMATRKQSVAIVGSWPSAAVDDSSRVLGRLQQFPKAVQPLNECVVFGIENLRARVRGPDSVHDQLPKAKVG
jgi:hypothetical protein